MKLSLLAATLVLAAMLLGVSAGEGLPRADAADDAGGEVIVELRIWQDVNDEQNLHVSARLQGGRWDAHGTRAVQLQYGLGGLGRYNYDTLSIGGVELGIWQRKPQAPGAYRIDVVRDPYYGYRFVQVEDEERDSGPLPVFVRACGKECAVGWWEFRAAWQELGAVRLLLDDGHSPSGRYRYGDMTIAVSPTSGLLADREYLLALRDPLAGTGALNWSAGTPVAQWEGVVVEGAPPRVTALRLTGLGLAGEMWGWLADLTELRELWLDDNPLLRGGIPSKLMNLDKLTHLYLGGDRLSGCVPPPLLAVPNNNLDRVDLRPCPPVAQVSRAWGRDGFVFRGGNYDGGGVGGFDVGGAGTYLFRTRGMVFDMPVRAWLTVAWSEALATPTMGDIDPGPPGESYNCLQVYGGLGGPFLVDYVTGAWIAYYDTGEECERHVPPQLPQYEAIFDQLSASLWVPRRAPW